jgi:hypothetical protein
MSKKNNRISRWLDTEFDITEPPRYELNNKQISNYYKDMDRNLKLNDTDKINELIEFGNKIKSGDTEYYDKDERRYHKKMILESKLVQTFKKGNESYYHFLNPKTPRYHTNMLFNQIIDYCIIHNYKDENGDPLINKMLRNKFYEFCYDNSKEN